MADAQKGDIVLLVILAVVVFACMNRRSSHRRPSWARGDHHGRERAGAARSDRSSVRERFEEWHRTAHGDDREEATASDPDDTERV